jgi:hypothetical protein
MFYNSLLSCLPKLWKRLIQNSARPLSVTGSNMPRPDLPMLIYFKPDVIYYVALSEEVQMVSPQKTHISVLTSLHLYKYVFVGLVLWITLYWNIFNVLSRVQSFDEMFASRNYGNASFKIVQGLCLWLGPTWNNLIKLEIVLSHVKLFIRFFCRDGSMEKLVLKHFQCIIKSTVIW